MSFWAYSLVYLASIRLNFGDGKPPTIAHCVTCSRLVGNPEGGSAISWGPSIELMRWSAA